MLAKQAQFHKLFSVDVVLHDVLAVWLYCLTSINCMYGTVHRLQSLLPVFVILIIYMASDPALRPRVSQ